MSEFVRAEWERALRTLRTARLLVAADPDSAASRAYYAAFHALTALEAVRGNTHTKHAAIRAALHRDLVSSGHLPIAAGEAYDFLYNLRAIGDYGGLTSVSAEDAAMAITKSETFVSAVSALAPKLSRSASS